MELVNAAALHRVSGCVATSLLGEPALEAAATVALRSAQMSAATTQLRIEAELQPLADTLDGVPWLVLKGPALARRFYPKPHMRSYSDLDALIAPRDLPAALERLAEAGYGLLDRNWELLRTELAGEVHLVTPRGVALDLHWDVTNDRQTRRSLAFDTRDLLERSVRSDLGTVRNVPVLTPVDALTHTAVHAARSGGDRLVWLKDVDCIVRSASWDWEAVLRRADQVRALLPLVLMLQRSAAHLRTPVPAEVLARDAGARAWLACGRIVNRFSPVQRVTGGGSAARMLARATRGDSSTSARELARRARTWAGNRAHATAERDPWNASDRRSILFEAGGESGLQAYLDAIVAGSS